MMQSLKSNGGLTQGRRVSKSTHQLWLGSMHRCANIPNDMSKLTGSYRKRSEQHVDMSKSCIKWDNDEVATVQEWFDLQEPFGESKPCLKSLSSGLVGNELNCDNAEMMGLAIQRSLNRMWMDDVTRKRNSKVKTFQDLPTTTISEKKVFISPTTEPTSSYKQRMMRKATKVNLRNHLIGSKNPVTLNVRDVYIIDEGMLLHKVYWSKSRFSDVLEQYI